MAIQSVLIVGAGGLGVPAAIALARTGRVNFVLLDPDRVELSNLPRQVIFTEADIGTPKVSSAARHLRQAYPGLAVRAVADELNADNARRMIAASAFVIDATDNPVAKFLINDTCVALGRPFVYAGVLGLIGQVMTVIPGRSACLRCLFEEPPDADEVASCQQAGIVGPVAGAIGEIEAAEARHILRGEPPELSGTMLTYNGIGAERIRLTPVSAREGCGCGARRESALAP
ncbi:MAG: HesA/MoeB/ThiF family protein [Candidatus Binataceae bacterium]